LEAYKLLRLHEGASIGTAFKQLYPEMNWQYWRFEQGVKFDWFQVENQRIYLEWIGQFVSIRVMNFVTH
jgi:hypothetical protein